jgi:hypothetical protein
MARKSRISRRAPHLDTHTLVVDDGRLAGLLSLTDLARAAQLAPQRRR